MGGGNDCGASSLVALRGRVRLEAAVLLVPMTPVERAPGAAVGVPAEVTAVIGAHVAVLAGMSHAPFAEIFN